MSLNLEMRKTPDVNAGLKNGLRAESHLHAPLQHFCVEKFARFNFCLLELGHRVVGIWQVA